MTLDEIKRMRDEAESHRRHYAAIRARLQMALAENGTQFADSIVNAIDDLDKLATDTLPRLGHERCVVLWLNACAALALGEMTSAIRLAAIAETEQRILGGIGD